MKLNVVHGEARQILLGQVKAIIPMLGSVSVSLASGDLARAYVELDFELVNRFLENLETTRE